MPGSIDNHGFQFTYESSDERVPQRFYLELT